MSEYSRIKTSEWHDLLVQLGKLAQAIDTIKTERDDLARENEALHDLHDEILRLRADNARLREALQMIEWSNDSKWQADCARAALAAKEGA